MFDIGEVWLMVIISAPQSLMLSFYGEDAEHGDTTNVVLEDG